MYSFTPEKTRRLAPQGHFLRGVYGPFYLAISVTFYEIINVGLIVKCKLTIKQKMDNIIIKNHYSIIPLFHYSLNLPNKIIFIVDSAHNPLTSGYDSP